MFTIIILVVVWSGGCVEWWLCGVVVVWSGGCVEWWLCGVVVVEAVMSGVVMNEEMED